MAVETVTSKAEFSLDLRWVGGKVALRSWELADLTEEKKTM